MSDNQKMLREGFGMPFVWLFTSNKQPIVIKNQYGEYKSINQTITSFSYKYDEENDDLCTIKLHIPKVSILNHWLFNEDTTFRVQWGYILPNMKTVKGAMRMVAVRDIKTSYKSDGIDIELQCTDLVSYLKNIRLNRTSASNNFEGWLSEISRDAYKATVSIQGETRVVMTDDKKPSYDDFAGITNLHLEEDKGFIIKGKSKSIDAEIKERLNESTKGPLYLDGRDNVISVKNRNFSQAPYRQYTYQGGSGELIEFRAQSQVVISKDADAEESFMDQTTKTVNTTTTAQVVDYNDPEYVSQMNEKIAVERAMKLLSNAFEDAINNPLDQPIINDIVFRDNKRVFGDYAQATNIDGTTRVKFEGPRWHEDRSYKVKQLLRSPHLNKARREAILRNYVMKKVEKKYQATAKALGDPSIVSSKVYNYVNLSNRDKGLWYAISVSHDITPNAAYTITSELLKKPRKIGSVIQRRSDLMDKGEFLPGVEPGTMIGSVDYENKVIENISPIATAETDKANAIDMVTRVNEQLVYEDSYFTNDIPFNPKSFRNYIKDNTPNTEDV